MELTNGIKILVVQVVLELLIKRYKALFWLITREPRLTYWNSNVIFELLRQFIQDDNIILKTVLIILR